jgi:hypothetical protein
LKNKNTGAALFILRFRNYFIASKIRAKLFEKNRGKYGNQESTQTKIRARKQ